MLIKPSDSLHFHLKQVSFVDTHKYFYLIIYSKDPH